MRKNDEAFNADDDEIYIEAVPNAKAAEFLANNAPLFECPDKQLEKVYDFRWWTFRKHLRKTGDGWVTTIFRDSRMGGFSTDTHVL